MGPCLPQTLAIELSAVIIAVQGGEPVVVTTRDALLNRPALPSGPFETRHRTLEQGLRAWAHSQGKIELGYVEQLYTFADKDRAKGAARHVSIGYLGLVRETKAGLSFWGETAPEAGNSFVRRVYDFFPWEDRRDGPREPLTSHIRKGLAAWVAKIRDDGQKRDVVARIALNFPKDPADWNEELVLQRYELLWEAGLIVESRGKAAALVGSGQEMAHDHRRILATGLARLRAKIKYRPVVFELLPDRFTLLHLQNTVEALAGLRLHKQNFRRLVLSQGLVEEARGSQREARGRPARLYAFRSKIQSERAAIGTKLPRSR